MSWRREHVAVSGSELRALGASGKEFSDPQALVRHFFLEKLKIELPKDAEIRVETDSLSSGYILHARWLPSAEELAFPKHTYEEHGNGD